MITFSTTKYGQVFPAAVSIIDLIVVRADDSIAGFMISIEVKTYATDAARIAGADHISENRVLFKEVLPVNLVIPGLPVSDIFDGEKFGHGGKVELVIQEAMLTLPMWAGGIIT